MQEKLTVKLGDNPTLQEKRSSEEIQWLCNKYPEILRKLISIAPKGIVIATPDSSKFINKKISNELKLNELNGDGFIITDIPESSGQIFIISNTGRGAIFGAYRLFDNLRLKKDYKIRTSPAFEKRWIYNWQTLFGCYIHPPYDRTKTIFNQENLREPSSSKEIMRYFRHLARMGINGLVLVNQLHSGPILNYLDWIPELNKLLSLGKEFGLEIFLYGWLDPDEYLDACPYNPEFKKFWTDTIGKLYSAFPSIDGLLLNRFRNARGLYKECSFCVGKKPEDKLKEAERTICEIIDKYGGNLIEDICTDDYTRQDREVGYLADPNYPTPHNAIRNIRGSYLECGDPPCPMHPLLYYLESGMPNTEHIIADVQIFPEMRGKEIVPSAMGRLWNHQIRFFKERGLDKVMGIAETHPPDWDLASVDWYTFGRLAWNPNDSYQDIFLDWAALEYSHEVAPTIAKILDLSLDVSTYMYFAGGARQAPMSILLDFDATDAFVAGGVCDTPKAPEKFVGIKSPLDMYPPEIAKQIHNAPKSILLFDHYELTDELMNKLLEEKKICQEKMEKILHLWKKIEGKINDHHYRSILKRLELSKIDALIFSLHLELFLEFKRCTLTKEKLDEIEKKYGDFVGSPLTGGDYKLLPDHYAPEQFEISGEKRESEEITQLTPIRTLKQIITEIRDRGYRADSPVAKKAREEYEWPRWPE